MTGRGAPAFDDLAAAASRLGEGLHHLVLGGRSVVLKYRRDVPADFFAAEADGLAALAAAGSLLRVPAVLSCTADSIVLEDLGRGRLDTRGWQLAGEGLAAVHAHACARFGFHRDGYCGDSPQANPQMDDGCRFFAAARLLPQLRRAAQAQRLDGAALQRGERLCARLGEWLPDAPPVRVHGDLWLGNLHACGDGHPALIDAAAVHAGWAEADLAMLVLFGTPPPEFFAAYADSSDLRTDWRERVPLYNLYHLLNHLNLFGTGYRRAVEDVLRRFG